MDVPTSILFIIVAIVGILGIIMASIGINFYNKCKRKEALPKANMTILIILLVAFILLIVGVGVIAAYTRNPALPGGGQFAALKKRWDA